MLKPKLNENPPLPIPLPITAPPFVGPPQISSVGVYVQLS